MGTGFIALATKKVIDDGGSAADALAAANDMVSRVQFAGTPDTLEYLQRGGRLKGARALMANILHVRPVLAVVDGEVEVIARPRSHRKAMAKLIEVVVEDHAPLSNLAVMHTDSSSQGEAEEVLEELKGAVKPGRYRPSRLPWDLPSERTWAPVPSGSGVLGREFQPWPRFKSLYPNLSEIQLRIGCDDTADA